MAKQQNKNNWAPFGLVFVGSIIYLAVVISALYSGRGIAGELTGGIWQPILIGLAVIGSISLFFVSFAGLAGMKPMAWIGIRIAALTGFSLVALTVGTGWLFTASIIGFILAFLGSGTAAM